MILSIDVNVSDTSSTCVIFIDGGVFLNNNGGLNSSLKRFWDLESTDDKLAWDKANVKSLKFNGTHYEVAVPWGELPDNSSMAKKRLASTERRLMKDKQVAVAYKQVLNDYLDKKYIRHFPDNEPTPECQWLLPHFPAARPEKEPFAPRLSIERG